MAECRRYPEVVGELQGEDGNAFVVEGARDRARDVAGDDGDEAGRQQAGALVPQLPREQKGGDGGQAAEHGSQEHAHVTDVHGDVQQVEHVVDEARRDHQTRIHLDKDKEEVINLPQDLNYWVCYCRNCLNIQFGCQSTTMQTRTWVQL